MNVINKDMELANEIQFDENGNPIVSKDEIVTQEAVDVI